MIGFDTFLRALRKSTERVTNRRNSSAVEAVPTEALFIVAGADTGKTATLTIRMLIFVGSISPLGNLVTTFNKKSIIKHNFYLQMQHLQTKKTGRDQKVLQHYKFSSIYLRKPLYFYCFFVLQNKQ